MMVPQNRLIFWSLLILPITLLMGFSSLFGAIAMLAYAVLLAIAILDLILAKRDTQWPEPELPETLRLSRHRPGKLDVILIRKETCARFYRFGLQLPDALECIEPVQDCSFAEGKKRYKLQFDINPKQRGCYPLKVCYLERSSPIGLWTVRCRQPVEGEIRVYPNLNRDRQFLAHLFINREAVGIHAQRQIGKGRDFEKLREYLPGDSFEDIHWKATAKRGNPITKVFQLERTQEIYLFIDRSRLCAQTLGPQAGDNPYHYKDDTILERYLNAASILNLATVRQGDLFGLLTFSNRVDHFIRAKSGKMHQQVCQNILYALQPNRVTPDYDELFTYVRLNMSRRALIVLLCDLRDPVVTDNLVRKISLISRKHLVLVVMIRPPGLIPLFSESTEDTQQNTDLYQQMSGHMQWSRLNESRKLLQKQGVGFTLVDEEHLATRIVQDYLAYKQRQIL